MGLDAGYGIGSLKPGVCTSTTRPASPFVGQTIYMTDTDETAVWEGTYWEGSNRGRDRNVVINGAMQVHQRGASTAGLTTNANLQYLTADRFCIFLDGLGIWTQSLEADAPTGSGFRKSVKMLCTTADASPNANDLLVFRQPIEGQNLQQFLKGTASAKPFTLSFWVKSNVTGTYVLDLRDVDNTRSVSAAYTISASETWEKKTVTLPADTTGVFDNDNGRSLDLSFHLGSGSNYATGTLPITWGTFLNTNRFVGGTNLAAATSNYWQVAGVQLEAGAVATPFEFEDFGDTLRKCMRYFQKSFRQDIAPTTATGSFDGALQWQGNGGGFGAWCHRSLPVIMRSAPVVTLFNPVSANAQARNTAAGVDIQTCTATGYTSAITTVASGTNDAVSQGSSIHYTLSSEL